MLHPVKKKTNFLSNRQPKMLVINFKTNVHLMDI